MSALPAVRRRLRAVRDTQPKLRLVTPSRHRHTVTFALLLILVGAASVFATVALHALSAGDAVEAHQLEVQVAEAERRYDELLAEVAALEAPARIERVAVEDLGMVPAADARFLILERSLPGDDAAPTEVAAGARPDPLKPVLSADR